MKKGKRILRIAATVVFAAVFVVSAVEIWLHFDQQKKADDLYSDMISSAVAVQPKPPAPTPTPAPSQSAGEEPDPVPPVEEPEENYIPISVDFAPLLEQCQDVVGWLYLPDTVINYPVVQGETNDTYLRHMLNGKYNVAGSIFVDYRNGEFGSDRNYIIYGHNMQDGSMFGSLVKYKDASYYDEHPAFYFITPEKSYLLELYAGFVTNSRSDSYTITHTDETLGEYMARVKAQSTFSSPVEYQAGDQVVTLSTCSYEFSNARYAVVAIVRELN